MKIKATIYSYAAASMLAASIFSCGGDDSPVQGDAGVTDTTAPATEAVPAGGVYRSLPSVVLSADESATIYYTVDGTEPTTSSTSGASPLSVTGLSDSEDLRFFAVDAAGNTEVSRDESYTLDKFGPMPVESFTGTASAAEVTLSWANPSAADFSEVVIAAVPDVGGADIPAVGLSLAVGDTLSGGETIVYVGSDELTTLADLPDGNHSFVAWAHYEGGAYSDARAANARVRSQPQTGSLTVDVAAQTLRVTGEPTGYAITGDSVAFAAGQLSFDLTVTNRQAGIHHNTKFIVTSATGGAFDNQDGTMADGGSSDGFSFRYFGPQGLLEGQSLTRSIEVRGAAANGVVTLDFAVQTDPAFYAVAWAPTNRSEGGLQVSDVANNYAVEAGPFAPGFLNAGRGEEGSYKGFRGGGVSPDGRYVYLGARNASRISKIDLSTLDIVAGADITTTEATGAITDLLVSPDGRRAWALLNDGMHSGAYRGLASEYEGRLQRPAPERVRVTLVEFDTQTMSESSRIEIAESTDIRYRGRRMSLSADGRWAAIATGAPYVDTSISELFLVDLSTGALADADAEVDGTQSFDTVGLRPSQPAFSLDGNYVVFNNSYQEDCESIGLLNVQTFEVTKHDYDETDDCAGKSMGFIPRADGTFILVGDSNGIISFDPATGAFNRAGDTGFYHLSAFLSSDGSKMIGSGFGRLETIDLATGVVEKTGPQAGGTKYGHHALVTPF